MAKVVVGISEMAWTDSPDDVLVTHSLGSCLGVGFYDRELRIGGLLHCMLPLSRTDRQRAKNTPAMFVDTGVAALLAELMAAGCRAENLVTRVAGGARILQRQDLFRIGERNYTVFRKMLWKNSMLIDAEDVGGTQSRTVSLDVGTGRMLVCSGTSEREL